MAKFNQKCKNSGLLFHLRFQILIWYMFHLFSKFSYVLMAAHCASLNLVFWFGHLEILIEQPWRRACRAGRNFGKRGKKLEFLRYLIHYGLWKTSISQLISNLCAIDLSASTIWEEKTLGLHSMLKEDYQSKVYLS